MLLTALAFSGCTESDNNGEDEIPANVVAMVNGEEILLEDVTNMQNLYMQQGQQISEEQALEQLIDEELLDQQALQDKYIPTTEEAENQMEAILQQQGMTLEDYKQQLQQQGMKYEEFLQDYKNDLALDNYLEDALEEGQLEVTENEAKDYYDNNKEMFPENTSFEEFEPQIISMLQQQKKEDAKDLLVQDLRTEANIKYFEYESDTNESDDDDDDFEVEVLATVNGEEITQEDVTMLQQSYMQQGQQLSEEDALEQLIDQKVLIQNALQDEYIPTDDEAESELKTLLQQQGMTLEDYKQQLQQMGQTYEEALQSFKESIAFENYLEAALEEKDYDIPDEEAEAEIETLLLQYDMTLDELIQQLSQMGMTYEEYVQDYKKGIAREYLTDELKEQADIEYR